MESARNQVSELEDITRQSLLYDFYGQLLTRRQRQVMELYHEENLSLAEIAEEFGISRQGVHDALRSAHRSLDGYEEKLGLVRRFLRTERAVGEIDDEILSMIGELQAVVEAAGQKTASERREAASGRHESAPDTRRPEAGTRAAADMAAADASGPRIAGEAEVTGAAAEDLIRRLRKVRSIIDRLEE